MANAEHLEILERGVKEWNQWRDEHPETTPDLSNANLSNANLSNANLTSKGHYLTAPISAGQTSAEPTSRQLPF
jgi:hypothetical protein